MPLKNGFSRKYVSAHISYEMKTHPAMKQKQVVAIALSVAKQAKAARRKK